MQQIAGANITTARRWAVERLGLGATLLERRSPAVAGRWRARHRYAHQDETPAVQLLNQISNTLHTEPTTGRAADLRNGDVLAVEDLDEDEEGVNSTRRVKIQMPDGEIVTGYAKPFSGCDMETAGTFGQEAEMGPAHEVAAFRLATELGGTYAELVPATALRVVDGDLCSVCEHVPGDQLYGTPAGAERDQLAAGFFDALVGQQDRHYGNLRHDHEADRLHLIDHGFAFGRKGDLLNVAMLNRRRVQEHPQLLDHERDALRRLFDSPDLLGVGPLLDESRREALRDRAQTMLTTGTVLDLNDYLDGAAYRARLDDDPSDPTGNGS